MIKKLDVITVVLLIILLAILPVGINAMIQIYEIVKLAVN